MTARFRLGMIAGCAALACAPAACGIDVVGQHALPEVASNATEPGEDASPAATASPRVDAATPPTPVDGSVTDPDAAPPTLYSTRVSAGLVALYEFEEGTGAVVNDAVAPAVNLTIGNTSAVAWKPHAVDLTSFTTLLSNAKFEKAVTRCKATQELTVEAWVHPAMASQDNFGRLVTMADDDVNRNFALGSFKDKNFWASTHTGEDLKPKVPVPDALAHVVSTRSSDGTLRLYVDGALIGSLAGTANFGNWGTYSLVVGNVAAGNKGWQGEIHLIAIYDHALGPSEIAQNFAAGADP